MIVFDQVVANGEKFNYNDGSKRKVTLSDKEYDKMLFLAMRDQWNADATWNQGDYEFYNYALQGGELAEYQGSASFDVMGMSSLAIGALSDWAGNSKVTFRLFNNNGSWNPTFYRNGWRGNQWVTPTKMANVGKGLKIGGNALGGLSLFMSGYQFSQTQSSEKKSEHALDMFMGVAGFTPFAGPFISGYWTLGGKKLYHYWRKTTLHMQIDAGINFYPSVQPFK